MSPEEVGEEGVQMLLHNSSICLKRLKIRLPPFSHGELDVPSVYESDGVWGRRWAASSRFAERGEQSSSQGRKHEDLCLTMMLPLHLAHQGSRLQEAGGSRYTFSQQLISLRPGANIACRAVSSVEVLQEMKDAPASESFIRPHLRKLAAYTPIEPFEVLSKRLGRDALDIVKLDANENPYGPPPEVLEALGSMPFPNIYPDPETRRLRSALAEANNIPAENLLVRHCPP